MKEKYIELMYLLEGHDDGDYFEIYERLAKAYYKNRNIRLSLYEKEVLQYKLDGATEDERKLLLDICFTPETRKEYLAMQ